MWEARDRCVIPGQGDIILHLNAPPLNHNVFLPAIFRQVAEDFFAETHALATGSRPFHAEAMVPGKYVVVSIEHAKDALPALFSPIAFRRVSE